MDIKAAVLDAANQPFSIKTVTLDDPGPDEILVRIEAVGICHSDIAVQEQSLPVALPAVIGHEGAGVVEKIGANVTKVKPGDKVVLTMLSCGECENCRRGDPMYCENQGGLNYSGVRQDGTHTICCGGHGISGAFFGQSSFASHALTTERNTIRVDPHADPVVLAPLGCGVQTGAGTVMRTLKAKAGRALIVFGGGSVGLSAIMAAKVQGCSPIILVEPVAQRRSLALELGATHVIDPKSEDVVARVQEITGRGVDYGVDTTAVPAVINTMIEVAAIHAELATLGVPRDPAASLPINLLGYLSKGLTLKGAIEGDSRPDEFIPELYALYKQGRLPVDRLIARFGFDQINDAIAEQLAGKVVKPVLTF